MGLPLKALDAQVDMLKLIHHPMMTKYVQALTITDTHRPDAREGNAVFAAVRWMLNCGETYAVTAEIANVIDQASYSLPDFELHLEDLPSSTGFVYLEETQVIPDGKGKPLAIRAIAWGRAVQGAEDFAFTHDAPAADDVSGIVIVLFTDPYDDRDHMHQEWDDAILALWVDEWGAKPPMLPMWGGIMTVGEENGFELAKFILTFFRFIQEPWVDSRMMVPQRAAVKRARKARVTPEVRVVCLRQEASVKRREGEGESDIVWSHRWIVKPHWRMQWYPSQGRNAPRWIPSYIKGPADKPLIVHDRVFHVSR